MIEFRENIWKEDEYNYKAAYGFIPNIHAYMHEDDVKRDCMIICPGGGYCMCVPHEADLPAIEFYNQGMNVFVLTYTTDITMSVKLEKQPLMDVSRAVRYVRKNAERFKINSSKLILCGFSAGSHVCGSLAVHFDDVIENNEEYKDVSNRPDGVILSYPVVTTGEYTHIYSVWALVGQDASKEEKDYFSIEKHVDENTPPCFIWQTETDDLVPVENSYLFAKALKEKNIPFAHYVFPTGMHGLSTCDENFLYGRDVLDYTMEQVMRAVDNVKKGRGINVSEQRRKELEEQFAGVDTSVYKNDKFFEIKCRSDEEIAKKQLNDRNTFAGDKSVIEDVGLWTKLANAWIKRI